MTWARTEITKNLELNSECLKKVKEREKRENNISPKYLKKTHFQLKDDQWMILEENATVFNFRKMCGDECWRRLSVY